MDEAAVRKLLDQLRRRRGRRRRGGAAAAPAAVRRPRLRHGRPPPGAAPGPAGGGLRSGQDAPRSAWASSASCSPAGDVGSGRWRPGGAEPGDAPSRSPRWLAAVPGRRGRRGSTVVWRPAPGRARERWWWSRPGTADLPVAEECQATLRAFGFAAALVADVGVAGLHRLLAHVELLQARRAVVVVAGMEGALASVVGGLTAAPVVAVPTSVGYGAAGRGDRPAGHAGLVRVRAGGGRHRQRLRCRLRRRPHPGPRGSAVRQPGRS